MGSRRISTSTHAWQTTHWHAVLPTNLERQEQADARCCFRCIKNWGGAVGIAFIAAIVIATTMHYMPIFLRPGVVFPSLTVLLPAAVRACRLQRWCCEEAGQRKNKADGG